MSSSTSRPAGSASLNGNGAGGPPEKTYFEQQREMLVGEIAQVNNIFQDVLPTMQADNDANGCYSIIQSLEHVLQNINKLNRSLEEVIAVRRSPLQACSGPVHALLTATMLFTGWE